MHDQQEGPEDRERKRARTHSFTHSEDPDVDSIAGGPAPSHSSLPLSVTRRVVPEPEELSWEEVPGVLEAEAQNDATYLDTLRFCSSIAEAATGGSMLVVVPDRLKHEVQFSTLDQHYMTKRIAGKKVSPASSAECDKVRQALLELAEHSLTDRWPVDHTEPAARNQPKDGATIFSSSSTVCASAVKIEHNNTNFKIPSGGTRTQGALGAVEWMAACLETNDRIGGPGGVVFLRSDSGTVKLLLARKLPTIYQVETFSPILEQMLSQYRAKHSMSSADALHGFIGRKAGASSTSSSAFEAGAHCAPSASSGKCVAQPCSWDGNVNRDLLPKFVSLRVVKACLAIAEICSQSVGFVIGDFDKMKEQNAIGSCMTVGSSNQSLQSDFSKHMHGDLTVMHLQTQLQESAARADCAKSVLEKYLTCHGMTLIHPRSGIVERIALQFCPQPDPDWKSPGGLRTNVAFLLARRHGAVVVCRKKKDPRSAKIAEAAAGWSSLFTPVICCGSRPYFLQNGGAFPRLDADDDTLFRGVSMGEVVDLAKCHASTIAGQWEFLTTILTNMLVTRENAMSMLFLQGGMHSEEVKLMVDLLQSRNSQSIVELDKFGGGQSALHLVQRNLLSFEIASMIAADACGSPSKDETDGVLLAIRKCPSYTQETMLRACADSTGKVFAELAVPKQLHQCHSRMEMECGIWASYNVDQDFRFWFSQWLNAWALQDHYGAHCVDIKQIAMMAKRAMYSL